MLTHTHTRNTLTHVHTHKHKRTNDLKGGLAGGVKKHGVWYKGSTGNCQTGEITSCHADCNPKMKVFLCLFFVLVWVFFSSVDYCLGATVHAFFFATVHAFPPPKLSKRLLFPSVFMHVHMHIHACTNKEKECAVGGRGEFRIERILKAMMCREGGVTLRGDCIAVLIG
jgi:hypothetical protein